MNKYPTTRSEVECFNPKTRSFAPIDFLAKSEKEHSHNELNLYCVVQSSEKEELDEIGN